jgi:GTPase SAR1 family protein
MLDTYVHDANAIIYVYDITDSESFTSIDFWNREVSLVSKSQATEKDSPIKILLGNKNDMGHLSKVDMDKHTSFAKNHKMEGY